MYTRASSFQLPATSPSRSALELQRFQLAAGSWQRSVEYALEKPVPVRARGTAGRPCRPQGDVPFVPIPGRRGIPPGAGRPPGPGALLDDAARHAATIDRDLHGPAALDGDAHGDRRTEPAEHRAKAWRVREPDGAVRSPSDRRSSGDRARGLEAPHLEAHPDDRCPGAWQPHTAPRRRARRGAR